MWAGGASVGSLDIDLWEENGMESLSRRQKEVYNFIARYVTKNGFSPSLADVAHGIGLHESTVATYVNALKTKGFVKSEYRVARSLKAVDPEKAGVKNEN